MHDLSAHSHSILSCVEAKAWESGLLKGEAAEWTAMQRAGTAIACALLNDFKEIGGLPNNARSLVLVGKGHNGGDALLAAKTILEKFPEAVADVVLCFGEGALRPLARRSLDGLLSIGNVGVSLLATQDSREQVCSHKNHRVRVMPTTPDLRSQRYDLCLDGIFGFQFRPPLDPATAELIAQINAHPHIKFRAAVDLPSGLGETSANTIFRADFTYATGIVKSPVVAEANAAHVGRLRYLDLGFFDPVAGLTKPGSDPGSATPATTGPDRVLLSSILQPLAQLRPAQTDKRTYGHLFVVGGSRSYPGAVLMTVQAALRSGVGLLTAFVPESLVPEYAARFPEAMWVGMPQTAAGGISTAGVPLLREKLPRATALVIGPGLGADPETLAAAQEIVRGTNLPLLLDADALRAEVLEAARGRPFICTPHAGEFKRIAGDTRLRDFCRERGAVVVQKGPITRVSGGEAVYHSLFGGPVLARGGSGDLLAGLIGGLLAQAPDNLLLAAARGVVWHGLAADLLARDRGQVAVQTTQCLDYLSAALRETL